MAHHTHLLEPGRPIRQSHKIASGKITSWNLHRLRLLGLLLLVVVVLLAALGGGRTGVAAFSSPLLLVPTRRTHVVATTANHPAPPPLYRSWRGRCLSAASQESDSNSSNEPQQGIDIAQDERLYKVRLSRAVGIDWGTDLSFSFVYVRAMEPTGAAALSGTVQVGDQLCELTPIGLTSATTSAVPVNLIGAPFDFVMQTFASLDKTVQEIDLVFFRGTKDELKAICTGELASPEPETITVTVVQNKGAPDETVRTLTAPRGVNLRDLLVEQHKINVYQSVTRWTNCKGKQLCGTCIVNVPEGAIYTNRKSMDEASTLRENPDSYRLSCITFVYGDCTVETFPPINAAQWTR